MKKLISTILILATLLMSCNFAAAIWTPGLEVRSGSNITLTNGYIHGMNNGTSAQDAVTYSQLAENAANGAFYYFTGTTASELHTFIDLHGSGTYYLTDQINATGSTVGLLIDQDNVLIVGNHRYGPDGETFPYYGSWQDGMGGLIYSTCTAGDVVKITANNSGLVNFGIVADNYTRSLVMLNLSTDAWTMNNCLIQNGWIQSAYGSGSIAILANHASMFNIIDVRSDSYSAGAGTGLYLKHGNSHGRVSNVKMYSHYTAVQITGCLYTYFDYFHAWNNNVGLMASCPNTAGEVGEIQFRRSTFDESRGISARFISIGDSGNDIGEIDITDGCEIWSKLKHTSCTISYGAVSYDCRLVGNQIHTWANDGVSIGGENILVTDNNIQATNGTTALYPLSIGTTASGCTKNRIQNNYVLASGAAKSLWVNDGADYYIVTGNRFPNDLREPAGPPANGEVEHNVIW